MSRAPAAVATPSPQEPPVPRQAAAPLDPWSRGRLEPLAALPASLRRAHRHVSYRQAEELAGRLARRLVSILGHQELGRAELVAIPRGGHVVLGMLSYHLDQRRWQGSRDGVVVLVDDCLLSGLRLRQRLAVVGPGRSVVVAHLLSVPEARYAVAAAEPAVRHVVAADDLDDQAAAIFPDPAERAAWRRRMARRLGPPERYWIGLPSPVSFAWGEPDRPFWNAAAGRLEDGWRFISPDRCLKSRNRLARDLARDLLCDLPSFRAAEDGPRWRSRDGVTWGGMGESLWLLRPGDEEVFSLERTGALAWKALAMGWSEGRAAAALAARYDVAAEVARRDVSELVSDLAAAGLLEEVGEGSTDDITRAPAPALRRCAGEPEGEPASYQVFGRVVGTGRPLAAELVPAARGAAPDLVVEWARRPPEGWAKEMETVWASPERDVTGRPPTELARCAAGWRLRFSRAGDFHLASAGVAPAGNAPSLAPARVVAVPAADCRSDVAELRLLGPVMALWLELQGVPVLHGAAVAIGGSGAPRAVGLLAAHGGGKSCLAAALQAEAGAALLGDDLLAVDLGEGGARILPGAPYMRLRPADAERWAPPAARWPQVLPPGEKRRVAVGEGEFGRFHPQPAPLAVLLLPERGGAREVRIEPLAPAEALHRLVDTSYLRRLVTGAGLQPARLERLAQLVERVPVKRLLYPDGHAHLPRVAEAVRRAAEF